MGPAGRAAGVRARGANLMMVGPGLGASHAGVLRRFHNNESHQGCKQTIVQSLNHEAFFRLVTVHR